MKCYFHKAICGSPERACAFLGIEPKQKATVASSLRREFACLLDTGIPRAEPQSLHLFTLCVSRAVAAVRVQKGKKPKQKPPDWVVSVLAPPAGLEPATS